MDKPRKSHMDAAYQVLRYVKGTQAQALFFPAFSSTQIKGLCDSDWAACTYSR